MIVGLRRGTTVPAQTVAANSGARPTQVYQSVFRGFAANLSESAIRNLASNPNVAFIVADLPIYPSAQSTPTNLLRSGVHQSPLAAIDNVDNGVNADIAIIDSGVTPHGDLRVVGGHNCTTSDPNAWGIHPATAPMSRARLPRSTTAMASSASPPGPASGRSRCSARAPAPHRP